MQIVTDSGADFASQQLENLGIHVVPMQIDLNGRRYRSGIDISIEDFYEALQKTGAMPTTSEPSAEDFGALYQGIAQDDPEILSIHISSGLSKTYESAQIGAKNASAARIRLIDSKTVSGALGWQVEAAARASQAGWSQEEIMPLLKLIGDNTELIFTIGTLKYLIHGGRISHLRGLIGSLLDIKPVIGFDKTAGVTRQLGTARTMRRAIHELVETVATKYPRGTQMRFQVIYGQHSPEVDQLYEALDSAFRCTFVPTAHIAPVLGAHVGPHAVGLVYAPQSIFENLAWER